MKNKKQLKIGLLALSAPIEKIRYQKALEVIKRLGFECCIDFDPSEFYGKTDFMFSPADPETRARSLVKMLRDPTIDILLSIKGGYACCELIPYFDSQELAAHPKLLIGYSDTTAILNGPYRKANIPCIHGPSVDSGFARYDTCPEAKKNVDNLLALIKGELTNPFKDLALTAIIPAKQAIEAHIWGGNLSLLAASLGAPWEANFDQSFVFLEEDSEKPYRVHRMLLQLKHANKFKNAKAVILGSFTNCEHPQGFGPNLKQVFDSIFSDLGIPLYSGLPAGHDRINLPLPLGLKSRLFNGALEILEPAVV